MLAASHAIIGAVIAAKVPDPTLRYSLAIFSHPLLDIFPHWDFNNRRNGDINVPKTIFKSLFDAGIGYAFGFAIFGRQVPALTLFLTMFLAQLPDWIEAPYHIFNWKFPPFSWMRQWQHLCHWKLAFPWGFFTQLTLLLALLLY